jgi:hypothetical protein
MAFLIPALCDCSREAGLASVFVLYSNSKWKEGQARREAWEEVVW